MLIPCEVAVKCVLPVLRAMIAKELLTKHGLKQLEVANLLGVSQAAVSLYSRKIRGKAMKLDSEEKIVSSITDIASTLVEGKMCYMDFATKICRVCTIVRGSRLMCSLHKALDPLIEVDTCEVCTPK